VRKLLVVLIVVAVIFTVAIVYSYAVVSNGPINPLGRLSFVKVMNPDIYPDHQHSQLLAKYAEERGSACALIVHFAGSSNYRSFPQVINNSSSNQSVYIIEVAFIDTQGVGSVGMNHVNYLDSLKVAFFGVPDGRYKYMSDGIVYNNTDEMMAHVNSVAMEHGQKGPIPMVWHGSVRNDNPIIDQGCGFPLYFQILTKYYGFIPAYVYMVYGMIFPYLNNPYTNYELTNASQLQKLYYQNATNFVKINGSSNTDQYIINNSISYE
jgi:hypothetical protein